MKRHYRLPGKRLYVSLVLAASACFIMLGVVAFASVEPETDAVLWYFWGDGCPLCDEADAWLNDLETEYPEMTVQRLEVFLSEEGKDIYVQLMAERNREARWVPAFIYAERAWEGFDDQIAAEIEELAADIYGEMIHLGSQMDLTEKASDAAKAAAEPSGLNLGFWGSVSPLRYLLVITTVLIAVLLYALINKKRRT